MNKAELISRISEKVGVSKKQAEDVIDAFEEITIETLKQKGEVTLTGFGTFPRRSKSAKSFRKDPGSSSNYP